MTSSSGSAFGKERRNARVLAPDDPRHGTTNGYANLKCRCERCRRAWADYNNEYRWRTGRTSPLEQWKQRVRAEAEARDNHGTDARYKLGCRCDECMEGSARRRREHRHRNPEATRAYDRERKARLRASDVVGAQTEPGTRLPTHPKGET